MRIVIDTNIWISGLLWRGLAWQLLRLAEQGPVKLCMAPAMLDELSYVLTYQKLQARLTQLSLSPSEILTYVIDLVLMFEVTVPVVGEPLVIADPDDDIFLHCATVANATYIISGDHHLLDLKQYASIPILTLRDFLDREFPVTLSERM